MQRLAENGVCLHLERAGVRLEAGIASGSSLPRVGEAGAAATLEDVYRYATAPSPGGH